MLTPHLTAMLTAYGSDHHAPVHPLADAVPRVAEYSTADHGPHRITAPMDGIQKVGAANPRGSTTKIARRRRVA
jgi:hypothetical protein